MDFAFSPEQEELRRTVRQFLGKVSPEAEVRRVMATERGYDTGTWHRMATELGLLGMAIPEAYGGAGAGFTELGLVAQEMGRALLCSPFLAAAVLAAGALLTSPDEEARARWLPPIAAGELIATLAIPGTFPGDAGTGPRARPGGSAGWILNGTAGFVPDGHIAGLILVPAVTGAASPGAGGGLSLFAVPGGSPGLTRAALPAFDATRRFARLDFSATPASLVGPQGGAGPVLAHVFDLGCIALACELVGVAERALDMARDYALLRTQFGRLIGSFQAVKHKLADVLLEVEAARCAAWYGLWAADTRRAGLPVAASIAKTACSAAAYLATGENIQIHGGIGYTWEHPAHLYFRRAATSRIWLGDPAGHYDRLLDQLGY
jgi:alkylation response protein AidB-like acyl-CoA dehydrogenase